MRRYFAMRARSLRHFGSVACLSIGLAGCGYHVAGTSNRIPPDVRVVAIPAFVNKSPQFRIEQMVTHAVTRAFIERTNFRVTHRSTGADALLSGTILSVNASAVTFDPTTGRATTFQVQLTASVKLTDLHTHKVIFANPHYIFREEYQISPNASQLFEEDTPALERLSRQFASDLVTDILQNF